MTLKAAGIPIDGVSQTGPTSAVVSYATTATLAQKAQGATILAGFDWSAAGQASWENTQARAAAVARLADPDTDPKLIRALALVLLDEVNTIRALLVPAQGARTIAQLRTAIQGKINAGTADN